MRKSVFVAASLVVSCASTFGQSIVIEPDNYADGTLLENIRPEFTLSTTLSNNVPVPLFEVTATIDPFSFAPTGASVFGHAGVPFFYTDRRLRIDFNRRVVGIEIQFAGGQFFQTEIGRLRLFNAANQLIAEQTTQPLGPGASETLALSRPAGDADYAIAYIAPGEGDFGRFDRLVVSLACVGDLNGDGRVDESDLGLLLQAWQTSAGGDADGDGDTDESDLGILLQSWQQVCT